MERGESELNDLASRLHADHISLTALRGLGLSLRSQNNYSHTEKVVAVVVGWGGPESRSSDSLKMAVVMVPMFMMNLCPSCKKCCFQCRFLKGRSATRGQQRRSVITQLSPAGESVSLGQCSLVG